MQLVKLAVRVRGCCACVGRGGVLLGVSGCRVAVVAVVAFLEKEDSQDVNNKAVSVLRS